MSPQRHIRPEDLRPDKQKRATDSRTPHLMHDSVVPHDVASMEEAMVPSLSLSSYLALGTSLLASLPRLRGSRFFSEFLGLVLFAIPFLVSGYASGAMGSPNNHLFNQLAETTPNNPPPSSTVLMAAVIGVIIGIVVLLVLKSILDAQAYSVLRQVVSGRDSKSRPGLRKTIAFLGANLLQLGLAAGAGLGMAPVLLRLGQRALVTHELPLITGLVLPIAIGMLLYGWVRVLCMYVNGWMTWRPSFIAGALGAAIASPIRAGRSFWGSYAFLLPLLSASSVIIVLTATSLYATGTTIDLPRIVLQVCMIGSIITVIQVLVWFDTSIVASIGHRIGEYTVAQSHEEAVRLRTAALKTNLMAVDQEVIPAAPPGAFRVDEARVPSVRFDDVLQLLQRISVPHSSDQTAQSEPSNIAGDDHLDNTGADPMFNPWIADAIGPDATGTTGFARLNPSLLPVKLRTRNGQPERRYKGQRPSK